MPWELPRTQSCWGLPPSSQACTPAQKRFILDMMDALNRENLR